MLFNSYSFLLVFLPIVLVGFFTFSKLHLTQAAKAWLLLSSLFFYSYWDHRFLPLLVGSILFNYTYGSLIIKDTRTTLKKAYLFIGVICNLSLLFYFKYYNFFITNMLGSHHMIELVLPLGISFFTFTQIAFLVDAYQGKAEHSGLISYGLFVTIFPHLIAGPVLHHKDMLSQFNSLRMYVVSWPNIAQGMFLFIVGLFKKVMIADNLSFFAKQVFDESVTAIPFIQAWFGAISYTLQLYFDFSGYSDMAVGLGLLFNLRLPINFDSPYQADSLIDFWRRWHMTLSHFLRDYLYIPLGGNRSGKFAKLRNLFITMLLGGLWHGAGWTYVLWGACHGFFLTVNHLWREYKIPMSSFLSRALTLLVVIVAWVLFRSPTVEQAVNILSGMSGFNGIVLPEKYAVKLGFLHHFGIVFAHLIESKFKLFDLVILGVISVFVLWFPNSNYWAQKFKERPLAWAIPCVGLLFISFISLDDMAEFLYYQF